MNTVLGSLYNVVASSASATICSNSTATTLVTFNLPWGVALPLMQVVKNKMPPVYSVSVSPVIDGIDSIAPVAGSPGLYLIMYTATLKGNYDINVRINGADVSTDLTAGVYIANKCGESASVL